MYAIIAQLLFQQRSMWRNAASQLMLQQSDGSDFIGLLGHIALTETEYVGAGPSTSHSDGGATVFAVVAASQLLSIDGTNLVVNHAAHFLLSYWFILKHRTL
jgi:hypothetical protein